MTVTSIFGIQNGFNTTEMVESLIALQQKPLELKVAEREFQVEKLDLLQDLRNRVSSFKSLTRSLGDFDIATTFSTSFTGTGVTPGQVNSTAIGAPTAGTYALSVNQLALGDKVEGSGALVPYASPNSVVVNGALTTAPNPGFFDLTVGGVTTSIPEADLPIGTTLSQLADVINASGADVTATVVSSGGGFTLELAANQTGAAATVSGALIIDGPANDLRFDVNYTQNAQDSSFDVNGTNFTTASNTGITTAIPGLSLELVSVGTGNLTVSQDTSAFKGQIEDFVDSYNELQEFIRENAYFDTVTLESGPLFGHFSVRNLQSTLGRIATDQVNAVSGSFQFLSQIGITTQDNGDLFINDAKLNSSIGSDPQGVIDVFGKNGTTTNSLVTFSGFNDNTSIGTFDLQVNGGVLEIRQGSEPFTAMVNVLGNSYTGATGTAAEGLVIEIDPSLLLSDGNKGTITIDSGVADQLTRELTFQADVTQTSPLMGDINTLSNTIEELNETIIDLDDRLQLFEEQIRQDFINLEIILGQLDSQRRAFESSVNSLSGLFSKK